MMILDFFEDSRCLWRRQAHWRLPRVFLGAQSKDSKTEIKCLRGRYSSFLCPRLGLLKGAVGCSGLFAQEWARRLRYSFLAEDYAITGFYTLGQTSSMQNWPIGINVYGDPKWIYSCIGRFRGFAANPCSTNTNVV